jgi:hypothetical protein
MNKMTFLTPSETTISDDWYFERLRLWRDSELKASDWTQIADSVCDKAAWATYRQALRDLPAQSNNPNNLVFPAQPGGN